MFYEITHKDVLTSCMCRQKKALKFYLNLRGLYIYITNSMQICDPGPQNQS